MEPIGELIAEQALAALTVGIFASTPGCCQMFVRQVVQVAIGHRFDGYWRDTAYHTLLAFLGSRHMVWHGVGGAELEGRIIAGDLIYKGLHTDPPFGHAAIAFHNVIDGKSVLCLAENSVSQLHRLQGAKGWRTLEEFGNFEGIVRLT